tara:strand:- start:1399 stop:2085 length:687 start_codon:yes stop_codon:yes gene_type:complete
MSEMISNVNIIVSDKIFIKNPESSDLGRKIISGSIDLIDEIGFECFTFRKLAQKIESTEASVYRYFENKQRLLLYLSCWYWSWMEYRLVFRMANIDSAQERLGRAIQLFAEKVEEDGSFQHINEVKLNRIVIAESSKAYMNKHVDEENKIGAFATYKQLVGRVSDLVLELRPDYKYPHMLISAVIEDAHQQRFFAEHLPRLTDKVQGEDSIVEFHKDLVFKTLELNNN